MLKKIVEYISAIGESFIKEIQMIFSDSAIYVSYIGGTLLVALLYSYTYSNEIIKKVPVAIVDQDQTQMSHQVIRMIGATEQVEASYSGVSMDKAHQLFDQGKVKGILIMPQNFSKKIQKGEVPTISAYYDGSYMLYYKQMRTAVVSAVGTFSAQVEVSKLMAGGLTQTESTSSRRTVTAISNPLFNINSGYATFLMPIVFIIAIQIFQLSAIGVLGGTQRERKTFLASYPFIQNPLGSIFVLLGRSGAYSLISLTLMIILIGLVMPLFGLPQRGNPWEALLFLVPFFLSLTFLGITLTNFFRHREDALMIITISSIPSLFLCGMSWPTMAFPEWVKFISIFSPATQASKGFVAMTQFGASLSEVKKIWIELWGGCLFYFILAVLTLKRLSFINLEEEKD